MVFFVVNYARAFEFCHFSSSSLFKIADVAKHITPHIVKVSSVTKNDAIRQTNPKDKYNLDSFTSPPIHV